MDIFKFKYEKTKRLFRLTIIVTLAFIFFSTVTLILIKLYIPLNTISSINIAHFLNYGYVGLFLVTFLGGTILPLGSPGAVATAGLLGMPKIPVILISTFGYTLGALVNYYLAYKLGSKYVEKKLSKEVYEEVVEWWGKWGVGLVIVFALVPILPFDMLALVCGLFRFNLLYFIIINLLGSLFHAYLFFYIGLSAGHWLGLV